MTNLSSLGFYRRILDNLTDAVLLFDQELALIYINLPGEVLFALSARQILRAKAQNLLIFNESIFEDDLRRVMSSGISLTRRNVMMNLPVQAMNVNVTLTPVLDEVEPLVLVELQQVDRHLRISMEEQLNAQQNAAKMLLRGLAHEIKNPLGGLRGAAQLLLGELQDEELREYIGIIIDESDRLQSLVDRMLAPHKPSRKSPLNVHRVLERVRQLVQVEAPAGVSILRDYDPSIPPVNGDNDQLIQALLNIVRNAAQAVGKNGNITLRSRIQRQVTIGSRRHPLVAKIEVIDDGPGIQPELLGQIFYPMVSGRAEGSGLGLSIAQSLLNQHHGLVECQSSPGNTVFTVYLPLEKDHE
jgi:two-component system nitrogen regulation sensor histidine kinase GlnL